MTCDGCGASIMRSTMTHAELRDRVRKLITEGELPSEPSVIQSSDNDGWRPAARVGVFLRETCKICNEADPALP